MCDYSITVAKTRPAQVGDKLVTTDFGTIGFAPVGESDTAVCLRPGTEIAFDKSMVACWPVIFTPNPQPSSKINHNTAIFRQINHGQALAHHDALEFPDGTVVPLARLIEGQRATVLQLPAEVRPKPAAVREGWHEPARTRSPRALEHTR